LKPAPIGPPEPATGDAPRAGFEKVILRLVKGGPERVAIAAGQIDAVVDSQTGKVILLPEARQAIQARETKFRELLDLCSDWTWEQDEHHRFAVRSGDGIGRSGLDDAQVIGKTLWDLPFDNMSDADWQRHRTVLEWRYAFRELELRHVDSAGNEHHLRIDGAPIFDEQDVFRGYRGTARDITARKHTEALDQRADREARSALNALAAEISVLDAAGTVVMTNTVGDAPAIAGGRLGARVRDGTNYLTLCNHTTGEERADATAIADGVRKILAGECGQFSHEYASESPDGPTWFVLTVRGYREGNAVRAVMSRENITERKRAEQLLGLDYSASNPVPGEGREPENRVSVANRLLAALPHAEYTRLLAGMEPVSLARGEVLHDAGNPIRQIYFPIDALVAVLTTAAPNRTVGAGLVGPEGMVGVSLALGTNLSPVRTVVQSAGTAMRMGAAAFRKQLPHNLPLQRILNRYAHATLAQFSQMAACNRFHDVSERLARWLLMAFDRGRLRELHITQAGMAQLLGVARAGVAAAVNALRKHHLISYQLDRVQLIDRKGLEKVACQCYRVTKNVPL
jgi:PAS domain S-box-containing protein